MGKFKTYLLKEMPQYFNSNGDIQNNVKDNSEITQDYLKSHKKVGEINFNNKNISIYFAENGILGDYAFIYDNKTLAEYSFEKSDQFIETTAIWQIQSEKGLMRYIFVEYIIPKYKTVVSDYRLSQLGFNFWKNLYTDNNVRYDFGWWDANTDDQGYFTDVNQLNDFFSENEEHKNIRFFVADKL